MTMLSPPVTSSAELLCPHCDYNLVGTLEPRCPECGRPFDRAALERWPVESRLSPLHLLGDERSWMVKLFVMSFTQPARIGRLLPPMMSPGGIRWYAEGCRLLAAGVLPTLMLFVTTYPAYPLMVPLVLLPSLPLLFSSVLCEWALPVILAAMVEPRWVPDGHRYRFWRNLCRCFTPYLLMTMLATVLSSVLALWFMRNPAPLAIPIWLLPMLAALVSWSYALSRAVLRRAKFSAGPALALIYIPMVGLVSAIIGTIVGVIALYFLLRSCPNTFMWFWSQA